MAMFQYDMPGDGENVVSVSNDAAAQAKSFFEQGRYLITALQLNSLLTALANLLDLLSNPNAAIKNAGINYLIDTYYGSNAAMNGKEIGVIGAFPEPSTPGGTTTSASPTGTAAQALPTPQAAWRATAEVIIRLGQQPEEDAATDVDPGSGVTRLVELVGLAGDAAYPEKDIDKRTTIRVSADVARAFLTVWNGATALAIRLVATERGDTATANAIGLAEVNGARDINAIAAIFVAERKKQTIAAVVGGAALPVMFGLGRLAT